MLSSGGDRSMRELLLLKYILIPSTKGEGKHSDETYMSKRVHNPCKMFQLPKETIVTNCSPFLRDIVPYIHHADLLLTSIG